MGVLTDWCGVTVPLTVAAAGGLIGGVGDLDFSPSGEKEDVRAHFRTFFGGGSDHHRGGVLQGASVAVRVEEASGGDRKSLGVEDGEQEKEFFVFFLFKSCIRLFKGTKNSHAAVSYGVNKTHKTNN